MKKKGTIHFTTFEESENVLREYNKQLSPEQRLHNLSLLRKMTLNVSQNKNSVDKKIHVYQISEGETLSEFFLRIANRHA